MNTNNFIREAIDADYPQILAIYRYYWDKHFEKMPTDYEKILAYFKESFDKRQGHFNFWVVDNGEGEIYGWECCLPVYVSPFRRDYNGEIITYLRHDKRNEHISQILAGKVVGEILKNSELLTLYTFIASTNIASQKAAEYFGFIKEIEVISDSKYTKNTDLWIKTYER